MNNERVCGHSMRRCQKEQLDVQRSVTTTDCERVTRACNQSNIKVVINISNWKWASADLAWNPYYNPPFNAGTAFTTW